MKEVFAKLIARFLVKVGIIAVTYFVTLGHPDLRLGVFIVVCGGLLIAFCIDIVNSIGEI